MRRVGVRIISLAKASTRAGLTLCGILLGLAAAPAFAADGGCSTSPTDTGFAEVVFDTSAGTFGGVLPFDVPVRICAVVPQQTTVATVKYAANLRRRGPIDVAPDCTIRTAGVNWSPESIRVPNGTTVRWTIDRLEAERYYAFCFGFEKKATDDEIKAFRTRALAALDEGIGQLTSATLTPQDTQMICDDLRKRLLEVTGTDQVLRTAGTIFDCNSAKMADFAGKINREVLQPQRRVQIVLAGPAGAQSLAQQQANLQAELAVLQSNPALTHLMSLVEEQSALDPAVDAQVKSLCAGCAELAGPGAAPASQLGFGATVGAAALATPLSPGSDPAQADAMVKSYAATEANLSSLRSLISWATTGNGAATVGTGLNAAERNSLTALAQAGGALDTARGHAFSLRGLSQNLANNLTARAQALAARAEELVVDARTVILADASTQGNFTTRQTNSINLDAGFVWAPELDEVVPYAGTNFYLRPVNRDAALASLGNFRETFTRRFSFTLALTASSIADENDTAGMARDDLFASQSLLGGAGLRVTDSIRVGSGAIVFKRKDPNPTINDNDLYFSYYLTLSFDLDVVRLFSAGLGGVLNPTPAPRPAS